MTAPRRRRQARGGGLLTLLALAVVVAFVWGDRLLGEYQQRQLALQREARQRLERMTMYALRADVLDVAHLPDGRYRVTAYMENVYPERPLYVMVSALRVFAQVGALWHEVPTESSDEQADGPQPGQVVRLAGRVELRQDFLVPRGPDYAELLAGYFHVQFLNTMLTSDAAEPSEDVGERTDTYYVHLLPAGADVAAVGRLNGFPGGRAPTFVPMPPH